MNPLAGLLAAPLAASAGTAVQQTVKAAAAPFEYLLNAARHNSAASEAPAAAKDGGSPSDSLEQDVAQQLQQLLRSIGVQAGDRVTLRVNSNSGEITVSDDHDMAATIQQAVNRDSALAGKIRQLAKANDFFQNSGFSHDTELDVTVGDGASPSLLRWL